MHQDRKLTCIVCPRGCELVVKFTSDGGIEEASGYACPRGKDYAIAECTAPVRTITSTVRCKDGVLVSVKTSNPIDKKKMFKIMEEINRVSAENNIRMGDVIIKNVADTGADIIATSER